MAKLADFSSPHGIARVAPLDPPLLAVRDQQRRGKIILVLSPPTVALPSSVGLGGPPFLHGDQFILDSILLSKDKCILSLPNTFSISGWRHQRMIHEFNSKLCVVVARGVSIGKNGITASQLNVFHLCLWRQPPPPNRRKKIKKTGCG